MDFLIQKEKFISKKNNGFAIPQILILGIGVAVGVSGLMAASILSLTGSRILDKNYLLNLLLILELQNFEPFLTIIVQEDYLIISGW